MQQEPMFSTDLGGNVAAIDFNVLMKQTLMFDSGFTREVKGRTTVLGIKKLEKLYLCNYFLKANKHLKGYFKSTALLTVLVPKYVYVFII